MTKYATPGDLAGKLPGSRRNSKTSDGCSFAVAEEVAATAVRSILERGAALIQHNTLERKSFPHAAQFAQNSALAYMDMCYPQHEEADVAADFFLNAEVEPTPQPTDPWARFAIEYNRPPSPKGGRNRAKTGRPKKMEDYMSAPGVNRVSEVGSDAGSGGIKDRRHTLTDGGHGMKKSPTAKQKPRSYPLPDESPPMSEWEEKLRADKARKRLERQQKLAEERRLVEEEAARELLWQKKMAEEAERGPCAYDFDGNVIWVEQLDVEHLPDTTCGTKYGIVNQTEFGEEASKVLSQQNRSTSSLSKVAKPAAKPAPKPKDSSLRGALSKSGRHDAHKFTDGFHKPLGWQPPIWQIFKPRGGVVFHCDGHMLEGQNSSKGQGNQMTRKEYEAMVAGGMRPSSAKDQLDQASPLLVGDWGLSRELSREGSKVSRPLSASHHASQTLGSVAAGDTLGRTALAASGNARELPPEASPNEGLAGTADETQRMRMPPGVPVPASLWQRARQTEGSLGHRRHPRSRVPCLGSALSVGAAQPPFGATMGHGLLLNAETRDDFYFPSDDLLAVVSQLRRASSAGGICVRPGSSGGVLVRPASGGGISRCGSAPRQQRKASRPTSAASLVIRRGV